MRYSFASFVRYSTGVQGPASNRVDMALGLIVPFGQGPPGSR